MKGQVEMISPEIQSVVPLNGQTIDMIDSDRDGVIELRPAGNLDELTVNLPSEENSRDGQIRRIYCTFDITDFTLQNADFIGGNITSITGGDFFTFVKVSPNRWARLTS